MNTDSDLTPVQPPQDPRQVPAPGASDPIASANAHNGADQNSAQPTADPRFPADPMQATAEPLQTVMISATPWHRFGEYDVSVKPIGQGGMGNVHEARNLDFEPPRREALKYIRSRLQADLNAVKRFKAEVCLMASLQHPHIVSVYRISKVEVADGDQKKDQHFFTMSYEGGGDLAKLVEHLAPLPAARAARIVRDIASAIAEAHNNDIIHRDLKPANIVLRGDRGVPDDPDFPLVTDFGLAVLMSETPLTGTGPEGTWPYMPPEQAEARHADIGPPSDVYALGAILYELLTKRPPFSFEGRQRHEILHIIKETPPDAPSDIIRGQFPDRRVPPSTLEAICLKCLEKDPHKRYASAGELASALDEFLKPAERKPLSRRAKVGIVATVLAVLGLLVVSWRVWEQEAATAAARAFVADGDKQREAGHPKPALTQYEIALDRYDSLLGSWWPRHGRTGLLLDRAEIQIKRAVLLEEQQSQAHAERALADARKELEALPADDPRSRSLLAETYHNLGVHFSNDDKPEEQQKGEEYYRKAISIHEEVLRRWSGHPEHRLHRRNLALSHGYIGDVQLTLGKGALAEQSYEEAAKIRATLAGEAPDDIDALCLHARDFGNLAAMYHWNGELDKAIAEARKRVAEYKKGPFLTTPRLPGPYLTERANSYVTVAELELDRPKVQANEWKNFLDDALKEYRSLSVDGQQNQFPSNLAWTYVMLAKYHLRQGEKASAKEALKSALENLKGLPEAKVTSDDRYRWAQAHALLAMATDDKPDKNYHFAAAHVFLVQAVRGGFKHYYRLNRDVAFEEFRERESPWHKRYQEEIVKEIEKRRPKLKLPD